MSRSLPVQVQVHIAASMPSWTVQCDFDGTISRDDVTDSLLQRFGRPGWQALEEAWERGDIGSRECMKGQIALLDMDRAELDAHLAGMAVDPGFAGFVRQARRRGITVQVVSDGIDHAIHTILRQHGLPDLPVFANRLVQTGQRSWQLESPYTSAACARASGNCKCERLAERHALRHKVLYVGDGSSDFCVSAKADYVLAKSRLIDHCASHGLPHAAFRDFDEALVLMEEITSGAGIAA